MGNSKGPMTSYLPPKSKARSGFTFSPSKDSWSYLLGFTIAILLMGGFTTYHVQSSYRQELASWRARQSSIADSKTQIVRNWLKEHRGNAELQSTRPSLRALLAKTRLAAGSHPGVSQQGEETSQLLDEVVRAYGYVAVCLLDARGRVVGHSSGAGGISEKGAEVARAVARADEYRIDLLGEESGKSPISFSMPVHLARRLEERSQGKRPVVVGVVMLVMDPATSLFPLLRESVKTRTGETVLMRREGNEAVFLNPLRHLPAGAAPPRRPLSAKAFGARSALEGREVFGEFVDYRGVRILAATRRIPETGWGLASKVDREEALEEFRRQVWVEGLATALLVALIGGALWGHRRQVVGRILQREGEKFRTLLESAPDPMVVCDSDGGITLVNAQVEAAYGYRPEELLGKPFDTLIPQSRRAEHREHFRRALWGDSSPGGPLRFELFGLRKDGSEFPTEVAMGLITVGKERFVAASKRDITARRQGEEELRRTNRALAATSECNQALIRATGEQELMQEVSEILVRKGGYRMAWVGLVEQDEAKTVRPVAHGGFTEGYLDSVAITWADTERGGGPTGTAARTGKPVAARDISTEPAFAPWREEARKRGYASSIGLPLSTGSQVWGVLSIYAAEPNAFDEGEVRLLTELANDLAYGVSALRTRAAHARVEELDRFFTLSHEMLCIAGFDGYFKRLNPAWKETLGWSNEELLARPYIEFVHPGDREATLAEARKLDAGEIVVSFDNRYLCQDGSYKWIRWSSTPQSERQLVYAAARDITERKAAEEALRESEEKLRTLVAAAHDAIVMMNHEGRISLWNGAAERMFGYAAQEVVGRDLHGLLVPPHDLEAYERQFARYRDLGECPVMARVLEITGLRKGGLEFPMELSMSPLQVGGRWHAVGIVRDITDRKTAELEIRRINEELKAANQELEAFTYSVSHDLRAPLRHIDGFARLLLERHRAELSETGNHYLNQVCSATRHMGALIDDLLGLSRVARQEVRWQVTGLNSLVTEILKDLQPHLAGRRVEWKIGDLPYVECDPALMKIVFANLLSNAVKYTRPREPAVIEIAAATENGSPVLSVRDNGVGFSMKYADKLFGVFQRLHRQEDFEGTGVGLATVQRIIHKHGGRIWAQAELNQGATFHFILGTPAARTNHAKERQEVAR